MTIAAIATGQIRSALGVIRISGPRSLWLLQNLVRPADAAERILPFETNPRKLFYGTLRTPDGQPVDEVLAVFFPGPRSFTGEDSAEITLHGNPVLLRQAMDGITSIEGVRPAKPGEFTSRAFKNGRMDLTRAESVLQLIEARSDYEAAAARNLHGGELSRRMSRLRSALIGLKAESEAEIDFSTEDLTFESRQERITRIGDLTKEIEWLLARGAATGRVREGVSVVLVGVPNAGKSSLLNRLLGYDRAIVTEVAGTTRDTLSEVLQIAGIPVRLVDTAGIRDTTDAVEREGVRRTLAEMQAGTIVLHVVDASLPVQAPAEFADNVIHVLNKTDVRRPGTAAPPEWIEVSCKTGEGLDRLEEEIRRRVLVEPESRDPLLLLDRHRFHLRRMKESLERVVELWNRGAPDEIAALEINDVIEHAGSISGEISTEEILGRIFSVFCVGK